MSDLEAARSLNRTRRLATGLLLAMAVLFVLARSQQADYGALSYVAAFAEAAMVGALADWFAVTALFRSPFGLPIPHTAIIPRNKDRIGDSLSNFLEHNFITQEIIREELRGVDFAGAAAGWLAEPENSRSVSRQVLRVIPSLLRVIEDDDVRQFMQQRLSTAVDQAKLAPLAAELLSLLVASRHHFALFDRIVEMAAHGLDQNKDYIRWKVHENSPRWLPRAIDERFYRRLLDALESTLAEMHDEDSEWRMRFQRLVDDFIAQLRSSPEYETRMHAAVDDVLGHQLVRDYTLDVWHALKRHLEAEAQAPDSALGARIDEALRSFGDELLREERVRNKLNQWIRILATENIVARREMIADLVARVIRKWDAETMSRKLELHVGRDLQYIRINGTLVGGMVGLCLHAVSHFL
jgi:uncharacterized membrane-anchored protein YjiN (DUF445 family)